MKDAVGSVKTLNKARVAAAAGGAAAVGVGVGAAVTKKNQEKQAAVGLLMDVGIDFDMAVDLVERKSAQLG